MNYSGYNPTPETLLEVFEKIFPSENAEVFSVAPGRVNLIGDHTDYNNGFVLPVTIEQGVFCVLGWSESETSRIYSDNFDEVYSCKIKENLYPNASNQWSLYISGVLQEIAKIGKMDREITAIITGTVPIGAGLSSSAAIEVSFALAIEKLFEITIDPIDLIRLCQKVEINYAGVNCGVMDQFVSRLGMSDHALFLDCESLLYQNIPLNFHEETIVIIDSKKKRELAKSVYNNRAVECKNAVQILTDNKFNISSLRDVTLNDLQHTDHILPEPLNRRCRHVITENDRVLDSVKALRDRDFHKLGALMEQSHLSLKNDFEVSCEELDFLVQTANESPQLIGARMTGGGFGGATVNIVKEDGVEKFISFMRHAFKKKFNVEPEFHCIYHNIEASTSFVNEFKNIT
jgi:galactokinase